MKIEDNQLTLSDVTKPPAVCPVCGASLSWKSSFKGKTMIGSCSDHGFVAAIRHPLLEPVKPPDFWERLKFLFFPNMR